MFYDFPNRIVDYCNPLRLEPIKSILYTNPVNSTFEDLNMFDVKCQPVKVQPLFMRNNKVIPNKINKVPICDKPNFLNQGIPCAGIDAFILHESSKDVEIHKISTINCQQLNLFTRPTFFKNNSNIFKKPGFDENFAHQVDLNIPNKTLKELIPNPAWEWPFELDMFQKQAIVGLKNGKSVFVAAHTSAGKTVVAEYAIAMCHNRGARVIYTSPIKALSNQKYREFKITFGNENVGLLTGDIKTGTNRYILVMTTEILHNMLKNDCTTLRDLEVVIMDEVHYLNDDSRGHIWEQIMILLPKQIQLVMLSATVPNTMQFAEWLGRIRNTQIQVVSTVKRPIPLEIYLFTGSGRNKRDQFFKIMDSNKNFISRGYQQAEEVMKANAEKALKKFQSKPVTNQNHNQQDKQTPKSSSKHSKFQNPELSVKTSENYNSVNKDHNQWLALFEALKEQNNLPVICFMFSRNRIQNTVSDLKSINLLNEVERSNVRRYFKEIISRKMINANDKKLSQVLEMKEMLSRGVAMHHAGLLPILKEIVEILFSQGYVKILFATETFAVGVNMPARSVVFDSISKHDGSKKRLLLPGEFTQMAGRAGRRGLDKIGTVIILIKPKSIMYSQDELKRTLIGSASQLESKFKISYNMILSLYRNRQFNIQHMIRHSFIEADRLKKYDSNCAEYEEISQALKELSQLGLQCLDGKCDFDAVKSYHKDYLAYRSLKKSISSLMESRNEIQNFLSAGRLIVLDGSNLNATSADKRTLIPALVLSLVRQDSGDAKYKLKVLTYDLAEPDSKVKAGSSSSIEPRIVPVRPTIDTIIHKKLAEVVPVIETVTVSDINRVCQLSVRIDVQNIEKYWMTRFFRKPSNPWSDWISGNSAFKSALLAICGDVPPKFDSANYEKEFKIKDHVQKQQFMEYFAYESCASPLLDHDCCQCLMLGDHLRLIDTTDKMLVKVDELQHQLSDENLAFLPEYRHKVGLLKSLGFLHPDKDTIQLKGRIACEIDSYEIVVTEIILSGVLVDAIPCDIAATLSCLMHENKSSANKSLEVRLNVLPPSLQKILKQVSEIVLKINESQEAFNIFENEVVVNYGLVESVRMWTLGAKFSDIVQFTELQYGDVIRCLARLCELLRHCESAAKVMANFGMAAVFKQTQEAIFRGIVSTTSLYVDEI